MGLPRWAPDRIFELTHATRPYTVDILVGDTSRFPEEVRFYAKKMGIG